MNNTEKYWYALMPGIVSELMFKIMHYKWLKYQEPLSPAYHISFEL